MSDTEELRERFNDNYLDTNYGKVFAAKVDAKALSRKVIIESCIRTEGVNGEPGHIIQNDDELNEQIRYQ